MTTLLQASPAGLDRFQDDRFGMFIHWGLYSLIGANEWAMFHDRWSIADYELLADRFEATEFDADAIARLAAEAGQRYLTITSRHHDGFSMFDTAQSEYKVTNTPFGRDPIAELAQACARHGIRLGFYVSLLDWHHPAYRAHLRESSGLAWSDYLAFLHGQIRELCTQYGDIAEFWLDGYWPQEWPIPHFPNWFAPGGDFEFAHIYQLIHTLQPDAVVMNNHHCEPLPGEDVQGYEGDVPGENTNAGMNQTRPRLAAGESCQTLTATGYGFAKDVHEFRPLTELAAMLVRSAAAGSNFLLNAGPTPQGTVGAPAAHRLRALGAWLQTHGEGIYGTRAGVVHVADQFGDQRFPTSTAATRSQDGGAHYVHLLDGSVPTSFFVDLPAGERAEKATAHLLGSEQQIGVEVRGDGATLRLTVPAEFRDGLVTTVRLDIA